MWGATEATRGIAWTFQSQLWRVLLLLLLLAVVGPILHGLVDLLHHYLEGLPNRDGTGQGWGAGQLLLSGAGLGEER